MRPVSKYSLLWRLLCCILLLQLSCPGGTWAQVPATQGLGFLQVSGQVSVNGMQAADGQTIFPGDTVRTGADGAAAFNLPNVGALTIERQTEISFRTSQSIATMKQGTVDVRSFQDGAKLDVQFGKFVLFTTSPESTGILTVDANGAARVECRSGSIGVTAVVGAAAVVLQPGQSVRIGTDGTMQNVESAPGASVPATQAPGTAPAAKKSRTTYYILGAAGAAGATTAALLLISHKSSNPPLSPSSP
jgi:hypothetical protein